MTPLIIKPSADISKLVKHYLWFETYITETETISTYLSEGNIGIVFNFSNNKSYLLSADHAKKQFLQNQEINNQTFALNNKSVAGILLVICNTRVLYDIFNIYPIEISDNIYSINKIFDNYPMLKALKGINNLRERISFLENFILNNTSIRNYANHKGHEKVLSSKDIEPEPTFQEISHTMKMNHLAFRRSFHLKVNLML